MDDDVTHDRPLTLRYPRCAPWEEVWFCEIATGPDRGFWCRFVVADSGGDTAPRVHEGSVWGIAFGPEGITAGRQAYPLDMVHLGERGALFEAGSQRLASDAIRGKAGALQWSFSLEDRGRRAERVPPIVKRLGLVRRSYAPAIFDLRATGYVDVAGARHAFEDAPGVLGHLWGAENGVETWAWGHCNAFDDADAVFEGLSARLKRPVLSRLPLSTFTLALGKRQWDFSTTAGLLFRNTASWGGDAWRFVARSGRARLEGEAAFRAPNQVARVRYDDPGGGSLWCRNTRLASLRLRLVDPAAGIDRVLQSDRAAFEIGSREALEAPHIG